METFLSNNDGKMNNQFVNNEGNMNTYNFDQPATKFGPAGNTNMNAIIDLDDIFNDAFFPADLDFSSYFQDVDNGMMSSMVNSRNPNDNVSRSGKSGKEEGADGIGEMDWDYLCSLGIGRVDPSEKSASTKPKTSPSQAFDEQIIKSEKKGALKTKNAVIMIPPLMPRLLPNIDLLCPKLEERISDLAKNEKEDELAAEDVECKPKRKKMKSIDPKDMTEEQLIERRERNREHAKKSRIRKRVLLDLLQDQLSALRGENVKLRRVVIERLPHVATKVFEECTTEESMLLIDDDDDEIDDDDEYEGNGDHMLGDGNGNSVTISNGNSRRIRNEMSRQRRDRILGSTQTHLHQHHEESIPSSKLPTPPLFDPSDSCSILTSSINDRAVISVPVPKQIARVLMEPDFRLIEALIHSQQNFVFSDPSLPDNPIVYCSAGFCKLTGYKRQHILGRNCRFLQGPGTDQGAVDMIRKGVAEGCDISVCLLNYKADGSPFWNQFFLAALKDSSGNITNYVGVQCEVNTLPIEEIKDRVKRLPVPDI